jgi:hypothetical protein
MAWPGASLAVLAGNRFATLGLTLSSCFREPEKMGQLLVHLGLLGRTLSTILPRIASMVGDKRLCWQLFGYLRSALGLGEHQDHNREYSS